MSDLPHQNPVNPLPPVVIVLFALIAGVEAMLSLADAGMVGGATGVGWRVQSWEDFAFSRVVWDLVTVEGRTDANLLRRFVTYPFLHANLTHAAFAGVLLLALGKFVGEVFSGVAVAVLFVTGAIFGACVYGLTVSDPYPLIGAYPPVYALIGGFTYALWVRQKRMGENQLRAFRLIGMLLAIQLLFGLLFGSSPGWTAEVASFVWGFGLAVVLAPGGWAALLARLRQR